MIDKHSYARLLLNLRYSALGVWVNKMVKAFFPTLWSDLRNLAIIGHEPVLQKRQGFRVSFFKKGRLYHLNKMTDPDPSKRARAFHDLLRKTF